MRTWSPVLIMLLIFLIAPPMESQRGEVGRDTRPDSPLETYHLEVHFDRWPNHDERLELSEKYGLEFLIPLRDNTWICKVNSEVLENLSQEEIVTGVTRVSIDEKGYPKIVSLLESIKDGEGTYREGGARYEDRIEEPIDPENLQKLLYFGGDSSSGLLKLMVLFYDDVELSEEFVRTFLQEVGAYLLPPVPEGYEDLIPRGSSNDIEDCYNWEENPLDSNPDDYLEWALQNRPEFDPNCSYAISEGQKSINLVIPEENLRKLFLKDEVMYVSILPVHVPLLDVSRFLINVDDLHNPPYNLTGSGVWMTITDGGHPDYNHPDLSGRITIGDPPAWITFHPTHVCGIMAGDGTNSAGLYVGMAPDANVLAYDWYNPFDELRDGTNTYDSRTSNHSWGPWGWWGEYHPYSRYADQLARAEYPGQDPDKPHLMNIAAGNDGWWGYGTIQPMGTAKNAITVGAVDKYSDTYCSFTSRGPTLDGRLKPEVSAPGCGPIISTVPGGGYGGASGTSMATPHVTGVTALLIQQWQITNGAGEFPLPSTLKAILVHSAVDRGNTGPDYIYGYGRIDALAAVQLITGDYSFGGISDYQIEIDQVDNGETISYIYDVPPGASALKVTLAWDDPPGTIGCNPCLVNDLDLVLIDPLGRYYYPWKLDPSNPSAPATRCVAMPAPDPTCEDDVNNLEQVLVDNPMAGRWRIRVIGDQVPQGPQRFTLIAPITPIIPCVSVDPSYQEVEAIPDTLCGPGQPASAQLVISNCGNIEDRYEVYFTLPSGWSLGHDVSDLDLDGIPEVDLSEGQSTVINLVITPPPYAITPGSVNVRVCSENYNICSEATVRVRVREVEGVIVVPENHRGFTNDSMTQGLTFRVTNCGTSRVQVDLRLVLPSNLSGEIRNPFGRLIDSLDLGVLETERVVAIVTCFAPPGDYTVGLEAYKGTVLMGRGESKIFFTTLDSGTSVPPGTTEREEKRRLITKSARKALLP